MALAKTTTEIVWLRKLSEFGFSQPNPTTIYSDNQSAIALSETLSTIPEANMWKLNTTLLGRKCLTIKYNCDTFPPLT